MLLLSLSALADIGPALFHEEKCVFSNNARSFKKRENLKTNRNMLQRKQCAVES